MRPALIALGMATALVAGGCQYLLGYPPEPGIDDFSDPTPTTVYAIGTATIALDGGAAVELDRLAAPGGLYADFGAEATFTGDDGWYLRVSGAFDDGLASPYRGAAYVQLDRIFGTSHWVVTDPSRCIVTVEAASATALRGTATCQGMRWSDMFGGGFYELTPTYIEGEPAFDAEITFEALPGPAQS